LCEGSAAAHETMWVTTDRAALTLHHGREPVVRTRNAIDNLNFSSRRDRFHDEARWPFAWPSSKALWLVAQATFCRPCPFLARPTSDRPDRTRQLTHLGSGAHHLPRKSRGRLGGSLTSWRQSRPVQPDTIRQLPPILKGGPKETRRRSSIN
jgi:hypothetical protein